MLESIRSTTYLVLVATDGAPSMTSRGTVCSNVSPQYTLVMNVVSQIINKIMAKALSDRQFHMLLNEVECMYCNLLEGKC